MVPPPAGQVHHCHRTVGYKLKIDVDSHFVLSALSDQNHLLFSSPYPLFSACSDFGPGHVVTKEKDISSCETTDIPSDLGMLDKNTLAYAKMICLGGVKEHFVANWLLTTSGMLVLRFP